MTHKEDEYDDEATELAKFPEDQYERIPVADSDQANAEIAIRMFNDPSPGIMFGECRWFAPGRGMLFLNRKDKKIALPILLYEHPVVVVLKRVIERATWWDRWWARRRPGHWLNHARSLLVKYVTSDQPEFKTERTE